MHFLAPIAIAIITFSFAPTAALPDGRSEACCKGSLCEKPGDRCFFYGFKGCGANQYQVGQRGCQCAGFTHGKCSICAPCPPGTTKAPGCTRKGIEACVPIGGSPVTRDEGCEAWCVNPCDLLNGDVKRECGKCDKTAACHPGAKGYDDLAGPHPAPSGMKAGGGWSSEIVAGTCTLVHYEQEDTTCAGAPKEEDGRVQAATFSFPGAHGTCAVSEPGERMMVHLAVRRGNSNLIRAIGEKADNPPTAARCNEIKRKYQHEATEFQNGVCHSECADVPDGLGGFNKFCANSKLTCSGLRGRFDSSVQDILDRSDTNRSGDISRSELQAFATKLTASESSIIFDGIDANGDGIVTKAELRRAHILTDGFKNMDASGGGGSEGNDSSKERDDGGMSGGAVAAVVILVLLFGVGASVWWAKRRATAKTEGAGDADTDTSSSTSMWSWLPAFKNPLPSAKGAAGAVTETQLVAAQPALATRPGTANPMRPAVAEEDPQVLPPPPSLASPWTEYQTESGPTAWHNSTTGATTWTKPDAQTN